MAEGYKILATQPWVYSDEFGRVIQGFKVMVSLPEFGENHEIHVPKLDPTLVKAAAETLLKNRKALAGL